MHRYVFDLEARQAAVLVTVVMDGGIVGFKHLFDHGMFITLQI